MNHSLRIPQLVRYSLVGVGNTITDFAIFAVAWGVLCFPPTVANVIAFAIAVTQGFYLNATWTFQNSGSEISAKAYFKYVAVNLGCLLISTLTIFFFSQMIGPMLAKLSSVFLVLGWGYLMSKQFVFGRNEANKFVASTDNGT